METLAYVNPTSDIFIKYLFGKEEHKPILLDFINAVLKNADFSLITDLEIRNPFNIKSVVNEKESILDIKARAENGRWYNIEVQSTDKGAFAERSLYYWSKIYGGQLDTGEPYAKLCAVICINILNFVLVKDTERSHLCFMLCEKDSPELILTDHLSLHFLELPKITTYTLGKDLDRWLYYLKNEGLNREDDAMKTILHDNPQLASAREKYVAFTRDDALREAYESRMKWQRDYLSGIDFARKEGLKKGLDEGLKKGLDEGLKKGLDEGLRKLREEKFQTLMALRDAHMAPEDIARITRLGLEKVKAILAAGEKGLDLLTDEDRGI